MLSVSFTAKAQSFSKVDVFGIIHSSGPATTVRLRLTGMAGPFL
jgi:hypothetical protein